MRTSTHQTPSAPQISWPTKQSRNNWRRCQDIDFLRIIDAVRTLKILKFCFLKMFANSRCNVDICAEHFTVHTSCGSDNTFKKVLFSLRKVPTERFIPCTSKLWTDRQNYHMKCHTRSVVIPGMAIKELRWNEFLCMLPYFTFSTRMYSLQSTNLLQNVRKQDTQFSFLL